MIVLCAGTAAVSREDECLATIGADPVIGASGPGVDLGRISLHALSNCDVMVLTRGDYRALELDVPKAATRITAAAQLFMADFASTSTTTAKRPAPSSAA